MQQTRAYPTGPQKRAQIWRPSRLIAGTLVGIAATVSFGLGWNTGAAPAETPDTFPENVAGDVTGSDLHEQRQCAYGHDLPSGCTAWIIYDPARDSWRAEVWMGDTPPQVGGGPHWATHDLDPGEVDAIICPAGLPCAPRTIGPDHSPGQAYPPPRGP